MSGSAGDVPEIQLPEIDKRTIIGVSVAIAGNILISLALNLQKLSHRRRDLNTESPKTQHGGVDITRLSNPPMERLRELSYEDMEHASNGGELNTIRRPRLDPLEPESEPLLPRASTHGSTGRPNTKKRALFFRYFFPAEPSNLGRQPAPATPGTPQWQIPVRPQRASRANSNNTTSSSIVSNGKESDYLKSKLWCVWNYIILTYQALDGESGGLGFC